MTFLNPFVLFALAAAAIPIILHLIHLRRLRTIEFSTLSFLKELQKTKIRSLKLRQLLLLILRTLLILLIVLAFARPTLKGQFAGDTRVLTSAVLLLDDSYSMTASDNEGEYFRQARDAALKIVSLLHEGDEVYVVPLSSVGREAAPEPAPYRDMTIIHSIVKDLQTTSIHRHLEDGLLLAARLLSRSRNFNKEVYVISDFQEGTVSPGRTRDRNESYGTDIRTFFLPIGKREQRNFGIESATIGNSIVESNRPFTLNLVVGNFSQADTRNHLVSIFLNGLRVAQKGLDIPGGQTVQSVFSLIPKTNGFLDGMIELEDDDLLYDNRFYFSLRLPERIRVLLVGSDADTRYLTVALAARAEESSILEIQKTSYDRITPALLSGQDVVILTNPDQEAAPIAERIAAFVSNGGGLFLFPGPKTLPAMFNKVYAPLNAPMLAQIETMTSGQESVSFVQIEKAELRHSLFEGMFEQEERRLAGTETRTLETPQIRTLARFIPTQTSLSIVTLSNGAPFLLEQRHGSGRMLIASIPATLEWSDFPLKGLFVPLIHRSLSYLTQEQVKQQSAYAGDPVRLKLTSPLRARVVIQTPQGIEAAVAPGPSGPGSSAVFSQTLQPGAYEVKENSVPVLKFTVNVDPDESKTSHADQQSVRAMTERIGIDEETITTIDQPARTERTVLESRFGVELWKHLLIAALAIAVAEMIIARDKRSDAV